MKSLCLSFDHPLQGTLRLRPLSGQAPKTPACRHFDTGTDRELIIPLTELEEGSWELVLDLEYEARSFRHSQRLEIEPKSDLFKTTKYAAACLFHSRHPLHCTVR